MAVKNQKIVVGELNNPDYIFENDDVVSIEGLLSCAIGGDNLAIDTFTPIVNCKHNGPQIIVPEKDHTFTGIKLKDEYRNTNTAKPFLTGIMLTKNAEISVDYKYIDASLTGDIGYSILFGFFQLISGGDYPTYYKYWDVEFWNNSNISELEMHYYIYSKSNNNLITDNKLHKMVVKLSEPSHTIGGEYTIGYIKVDDTIVLDPNSAFSASSSVFQNFGELGIFGGENTDPQVTGRSLGSLRSSNIIFGTFVIKDTNENGTDFRIRHEFVPTIQNGVVCLRHYDYTNENTPSISYIYCNSEINPYEIASVEYESDIDYKGILTLDEKLLSGHYDERNIQELKFGTKIWYYVNEHLVGQFYIDTVERVSKKQYKLNTTSLIGLLDKQESYGGIYTMERFDKVLNDILYSKIKAPYTKAEYIYGTGTQCVDTNFPYNTNDSSLIIKFRSLESSEVCIFGSNIQSVYVSSNTITRKTMNHSGSQKVSITAQYSFNTTDKYEIILGNSYLQVNNLTTGTRSGSICIGESADPRAEKSVIYLLADNVNGTPMYFCQANIYSFKISSGYFFDGVPYRKENDGTGAMRNECYGPGLTEYGTICSSGTSDPLGVYPTSENDETDDEDIEEIDIEYLNGVESLLVTGWLPADTKRKNLHQLLLATNVNIVKKSDGGILLTPLTDISTKEIDDINIYDEGSVTYTRSISNAYVTEHEYYDSGLESETTLFDNTDISGSANKDRVKFSSAPIILDSLNTTGTLSIDQANENFAIVSGKGKLIGIPYTHVSREIKKFPIQESGILQNSIASITDFTLVNSINGESVLERLWAYKANSYSVKGSIVYDGEKCGQYITTKTPFSEKIDAFIEKMTLYVSSKIKSDVELIVGYKPPIVDSDYTQYVILTGSGTWQVPNGVSRIKVVLIGGGTGGASGNDGEPGNEGQDDHEDRSMDPPAGGEGGDPGEGGECGYIQEVTITSLSTSYPYSCGSGGSGGRRMSGGSSPGSSGGNTTFGSYTTNPSSGGYRPTKGVYNIFTGEVYCLPGLSNGVKGGHGGAQNPGEYGETPYGEDVIFNGQLYKGGVGRYSSNVPGGQYNYGGGAAVGQNGFGGGPNANSYVVNPGESTDNTGKDPTSNGNRAGGAGGSASPRDATIIYGSGGNGGHGGGGGGASGYYVNYEGSSGYPGRVGEGGLGGSGGTGGPGCIIIYY